MDDKPFLEYRSSPRRIKPTGTPGGAAAVVFFPIVLFLLIALAALISKALTVGMG